MAFILKEHYTISDLLEIMSLLRGEGGCPWDREQTHVSIRKDFLEETYEAVEAIDKNDTDHLCEELGDVLLQVVFHTQIEREAGHFDFDAVCDGVCQKLVFRHPHIFGTVQVKDSDEVLKNWDAIKQNQRSQSFTDTLTEVPISFPALMRAQKVQKRAGRAGMDYHDAEGALRDLRSEIAELEVAAASKNEDEITCEAGDLLFAAVNLVRHLHVDAEEALTHSTDKFIRRFSEVEILAQEKGICMPDTPIEELDVLWREVKRNESHE